MHAHILMYQQLMEKKEAVNLKEQGEVSMRFWREEKERRNAIIVS